MNVRTVGALALWRDALPGAARWPLWPGVLAAAAFFGLLLAFHQVVSGSVQQGELRQKATAMHAEAARRCNALADQRVRESCLLQLNAAPLPAQDVVTAELSSR